MNETTRCPSCGTSEVKGYFIYPATEWRPQVSIVRCEVCEGRGVATTMQVMAWEMSL